MVEGAPPRRNVGIFLDMENLFGGYAGEVTSVKIGAVVRGIEAVVQSGGTGALTASVRAYANWGRADMRAYQREILEHGIEPVQVFSFGKNVKNAADIELCVDVLAAAHDCPWIEVFVIVSGDGGFVPLIRRLHYLNKYAVVVSTNDPRAGSVNSLLASVADEYHRIDVDMHAATDAPPQAAAASASAIPPSGQPAESTSESAPTFDEYREEILALLSREPGLTIDGKVNTASLGAHLRRKWPGTSYTDFGSKTLGGFVEAHCALSVHRPSSAVARPSGTSLAAVRPSVPIVEATDRATYIAAVRSLLDSGPLAEEIASRGRLPLTAVGTMIRRAVTGRGYTDLGYPKLTPMLQNAIAGTPYTLVRDGQDVFVVLREDADEARRLPEIPNEELSASEAVRAALAMCPPAITYPEPLVLTEVIEAVLALERPSDVAECIDHVAETCPDLPAETIRLTLGLLWHAGVLIDAGDTGRVIPGPEAVTTAAALGLVVEDAVRRAAVIDWPVTRSQLQEILY